MSTILYSASKLVTIDQAYTPFSDLPKTEHLLTLEEAGILVQNGTIIALGKRDKLQGKADDEVYFEGQTLTPGLIDCHSHPLFAGSRYQEFELRNQGASYQEIHAAGGGIGYTVAETRKSSKQELIALTHNALDRMLLCGTTTVEVKSGYGLTTDSELLHLEVYQELKQYHPAHLVLTFLGAHDIAPEFKTNRADYIELVCNTMLPKVAESKSAEFCDIFCEEGALTREESQHILSIAKGLGLHLKIHAEEFTYQGGAAMAASLGATSVDHLQHIAKTDYDILKKHKTVPVVMPGTSFFLAMDCYAPAKDMWDNGLPVALGTDYNAGSCMSESMWMAMSLAVTQMKLTPAQALMAATAHSAAAINRGTKKGRLAPGYDADFLVLGTQDYRDAIYHFGVPFIHSVFIGGELVW